MHPNVKAGDLLYRRKGFVQHAGVYLGAGKVLHNSPGKNTEITDFNTYSNGKAVKVISIDHGNIQALKTRLHQILSADNLYRLTHRNCEHIANFLIYGRAFSPQIQASLSGALISGLATYKSGSKKWLAFVLAGAAAGCITSNLSRKYDHRIECQ